MSDNIMLQSPSGLGAWKWDSTNSRYYLEISGTTVAWIDANGNMAIKGRMLKI